MFLHYSIRSEDSLGNEIRPPLTGSVPSPTEQFTQNSSQRRYFYELRFLSLDSDRRNLILGPWFCRQYPGATQVDIKDVIEVIPNLDRAQVGMSEEREVSTVMNFTYQCEKSTVDEVQL